MQPRRIDGIYSRDTERRSPERRLVVPTRTSPQQGLIRDIGPVTPVAAAPQEVSPAGPMVAPSASLPKEDLPTVVDKKSHTPDIPDLSEPSKRSQMTSSILAGFAVLIFIATGFLGWQTYQTNVHAKETYSRPTQAASPNATAAESGATPNEAEVPDDAKRTYIVAPDMPRMLSIPSLDVHARILRMSVGTDGAIQAPAGIWDTGWYDGSAKPGVAGNAFIDGHVSGPTMPAVFKNLKNLKKGAEIIVERGDGTKLTYAVSTVTTEKLDAIDMKSVLAGSGGETLTIMTCGGEYLGDYTYDSRVIVVAQRS